ncbi:GntR family transcriptional regulator [Nonomuraea africana]|uniref:DNA-binding GntR family transcriptional regulator n=1 Tax=Nonomuraea africana TaxID=46171 RepID=A0ABR9KRD8_9ACTN|nr:winged helix-turn-helix domain-containing protein [Nonomuraea africana]MBE1564591.1 DNA-binding GntR family transcriptional regulator [Nonomuraea africana]
MIDFEPDRPRWEQIYDVLRARIVDGTYPPKHLLSEVQLMQEFGVARGTIRKAMQRLRDENLIYTVPNLGSFVGQRKLPEADDAE